MFIECHVLIMSLRSGGLPPIFEIGDEHPGRLVNVHDSVFGLVVYHHPHCQPIIMVTCRGESASLIQ